MGSIIWFFLGAWVAACIVDGLLYWYVVRALGRQGLYWPMSGFWLIHKLMTNVRSR